ncbi:hypothetical protein CF327_g7588, partial [Tilletia walkeri]
EPAYKRQRFKTGGKARESTATAPPARQDGERLGREGRTVTAKGLSSQGTVAQDPQDNRDGAEGPSRRQDYGRQSRGGSQEIGLTALRTLTQAKPLTKSGRRHGKNLRPNGLLGRKDAGRLGQGHRRMAPKVRWLKTRRTTGTAQTVRRDGETTGGSLTARTKVSIIEAQPRLIFTSSRSINPTAGADDMFMFFPILTISVHAISASVYRSGLVMPTILDRIHQALSAQRCNEEIFKGTVKKKGQGPQASRDKSQTNSYSGRQETKCAVAGIHGYGRTGQQDRGRLGREDGQIQGVKTEGKAPNITAII